LSNDLTEWFATSKRLTHGTTGTYKVGNKEFKCGENKYDCLVSLDYGRGEFNYGVAYYWAFLQTVLPDGRRFGINLGDGIGSEFNSYDKSTEDFILLDGKHFKLDITEMEYSKEDYMKPKLLKTIKDHPHTPKVFPDRKCELSFNPTGKVESGVNALVIAMKQYLIYGYFEGFCEVEGERIRIDKVFGHVEHVFNRW
jgi:hypothetical protein